ncbi:hypothetical protein GE061_007386 [Apolygus lucorum]|uniref:Uncharacterized protein n=1 Tax=Apolygus lucorum TaxID=248454 RepID=A0A8S9WR10_APOLU|nr:hypothetical protein GE061_007386 [Apolygus lucorum]
MRSHLIKGLLLLSCIFVLSESRAVTQKEKHYLLERISEWDKAPEAVKIVEGRVTTRHGTKKYRFVYKAEDCSSCEAVLNVKKSGKGHYTWECKRRDVYEWALRLKKLDELKHLVEKHLLKASTDQGQRYNLRRRPDKFSVGDLVLHKSFNLSSAEDRAAAKLFHKYKGPFSVMQVTSGGVCKLQDSAGKEVGMWHPSLLKPYFPPSPLRGVCAVEKI